jgi:hypothetical protein
MSSICKESKICFILGFLSFCFGPLFGIPAIIYGHRNISKLSSEILTPHNKLIIRIGIGLGYVGIVVYSVIIMIIIRALLNLDAA